MLKVLILGAPSYLGNRIATLLIQTGQYFVYGIARSPAIAKRLAAQEITPVACEDPANDPEPYLALIRDEHIDVILDVAGKDDVSWKFFRNVARIGRERQLPRQGFGMKSAKLGFIYCSKTWVHGSSYMPVNELDLVHMDTNITGDEIMAQQIDMEKVVLEETRDLDVMILRPALLYGGEGELWARLFRPVFEAIGDESNSIVPIPLDADCRPGFVHVDDAAKAFVKAVEKLPLISGTSVFPVFDLVTSQESMREIFDTLASYLGVEGRVQLIGHGDNLFYKAMSSNFRASSARAKQLLGWEPTRLNGFVQDMDIFASAIEAKFSE